MNIIEIEGLSKKYQIHRPISDSLKEKIGQKVKNFFSFSSSNRIVEEFWALKDIHLKIKEGDRIGIVGRNGAGKSTFLKILSRITEPTQGLVKIRGRVSSLLEVGTGFHPDLTGRENIFLNGVIMGMSYQEIKKKFDEIVSFAGIEQFLDTPLKRYSSGMFMRLGFAISAHLDSEIMIVDEVLAVGDALFQEKCLKKMEEMSKEKRTILFVSHHVQSILALCNRGILLEKGKLEAFEPIEECISRYIRSCPAACFHWEGEEGDSHIRLFKSSVQLPGGREFFYDNEKASLEISFEILAPHPDLVLGFSLWSAHHLVAKSYLPTYLMRLPKIHHVSFPFDLKLFHPGEYYIQMECSLGNKKDIFEKEIKLKLPIYSQEQSLHLRQKGEEGISLGNAWQF